MEPQRDDSRWAVKGVASQVKDFFKDSPMRCVVNTASRCLPIRIRRRRLLFHPEWLDRFPFTQRIGPIARGTYRRLNTEGIE